MNIHTVFECTFLFLLFNKRINSLQEFVIVEQSSLFPLRNLTLHSCNWVLGMLRSCFTFFSPTKKEFISEWFVQCFVPSCCSLWEYLLAVLLLFILVPGEDQVPAEAAVGLIWSHMSRFVSRLTKKRIGCLWTNVENPPETEEGDVDEPFAWWIAAWFSSEDKEWEPIS